MKRLSSSPETLGSLFYPPREKKNQKSHFVYRPEFQEMLEGIEEDDCKEERNENKRRLSFDQVKALEKIFEVDNKLDPERKTKIAQELGLQPRQVAIWFQNRRARSKTKRLERDYEILKTSYEDLKLSYEKLEKDKEVLVEELKELREETRESNSNCAKEGTLLLKNVSGQSKLMNPFENNHKQKINTPNNGNLRSQLLLLSDNSNCRTSPPAASSSVHLQHDHSSASMRSSPQWIMNCCDEFLGASPFQVNVGPPQEVLGMGEHYCWLGADQESSSSNIFSLDQAPNQQQWHY